MMYRRLIVSARGFSQDLGEQSGVDLLDNAVHSEFACPGTRVPYAHDWHTRPNQLFNWLSANLESEARIDFFGFSNGGGVFFPRFQRLLLKYQWRLNTVLLIDPVNSGGRLNPRRWFGGGQTKVVNADRVVVYTQNVDHPRSAGVTWKGGVIEYVAVNVPHGSMDNNPMVRNHVMEALRE